MAEVSVFRDVLSFFNRLGIYDVVLPFLLTFSIFFAILEKTKLFGTEKSEGHGGGSETTKKNLNAMVAFCGSFFVIASSKMVNIIQEGLSNIILLLLISVSFLLLIGVFYKEGEAVALEGKWRNFMMILMFVAVVLIFAHAIPTDDGTPWLNFAYNYILNNFDSTAVSSIVLGIIVIGIMIWITRGDSGTKEKAKS
jgi:hypothetical protein